jgi:hypothetical protein
MNELKHKTDDWLNPTGFDLLCIETLATLIYQTGSTR